MFSEPVVSYRQTTSICSHRTNHPKLRYHQQGHPRLHYQAVPLFAFAECPLYSLLFRSAATELLIMRVWYRTKAWIERFFSADVLPGDLIVRCSPANKLPQEIVDMIISHLVYNTRNLLACSLTCYSWYIASVPHLHRTLVALTGRQVYTSMYNWPKPLQNTSRLGLLPFVKKLFIWDNDHRVINQFSPERFNHRILRQFSGLTNVRELYLGGLNILSFMPRVPQFFGHFLPTLRSLALWSPRGSSRQIIFFTGLFRHLEDLTLRYVTLETSERGQPDDLTLIPPFAPPLRGRFVAMGITRAGFLQAMIRLLGGIRFRYMDLFNVGETRLILNACADTVETLRLYPADPLDE